MTNNKLRIVIPTYNRATMAIKLLDSIDQASMHPNIEVIVIDDFSNSKNRNALKKEAKKRSHIKFIFSSVNTGGAESRNVGAFTDSEQVAWVWFIDDDDFIVSSTILYIFKLLSQYPNHNLYLIQANFHTPSGKKISTPQGKDLFKQYSRYGNDVNTSCAIFNFELFKQLKGWDPNLVAGQDADLLLRAAELTDAFIIPNCSMDVIQHDQERITTNPKKQLIGKVQFIRKNYRRLHPLRLSRYIITTITFYPYLRRFINK